MTDLQELRGAAAGVQGVGKEHLVPQALVVTEQEQLGAWVRPFAPHGDAGAGRVAGKVDHAGQVGDLGTVPQRPVLVQGGVPDPLGQSLDRAADGFGDCASDREPQVQPVLAQGPDAGEEGFRGSGAVGADQDLGAVPVGVGDLREGIVQYRKVIGSGVGSGAAGCSRPDTAAPVFARKHSSGWKPKPPL